MNPGHQRMGVHDGGQRRGQQPLAQAGGVRLRWTQADGGGAPADAGAEAGNNSIGSTVEVPKEGHYLLAPCRRAVEPFQVGRPRQRIDAVDLVEREVLRLVVPRGYSGDVTAPAQETLDGYSFQQVLARVPAVELSLVLGVDVGPDRQHSIAKQAAHWNRETTSCLNSFMDAAESSQLTPG